MSQKRLTPEQIIPKLRTVGDVDGFRMLGTTRFLNVPFGARTISLIPEHYSDSGTSELEVAIEEVTDAVDIRLMGELKPALKDNPEMYRGDDPGM